MVGQRRKFWFVKALKSAHRKKLAKSYIFFDPSALLILAKFDQAKPRWKFVFTSSLDLDTCGLKKSITLLLLILL